MARVKPRFTGADRTKSFSRQGAGANASTRTLDTTTGLSLDTRIGANTKALIYPHFGNTDTEGGHCVVFRINKTNRNAKALKAFREQLIKSDKVNNKGGSGANPQFNQGVDDGRTLKADAFFSRSGIEGAGNLIAKAPRDNLGGDSLNAAQIGKRLEKAIILYMPPQVQTTYTLNYSDVDLGFMSQAMVGVFDALGGKQSKETAVQRQQIDAWAEAAALGGLNMAAPGARAALQIRQGAIISNKMELSFTGVTRREFQFVFNFTPKSGEEAKVIHDIVKTFKYYAHPAFIQGAKGNAMTIPDSFDIEYRSRGANNDFIHKISTCFCYSINVQYGGDRYTAHVPPDGGNSSPPTNTILTLGFKEMELITKKAIELGY